MIVCDHCLRGILSREKVRYSPLMDYEDIPKENLAEEDEYGDVGVKCDWCKEVFAIDEMVELI